MEKKCNGKKTTRATITRDRYRILSTGDVNVDVYGASASPGRG